MRINNKAGITLSSLVIYILLFTTFSIFVSIISTNMNNRLFNSRGEAINYSNLNKLQYNIETSALNSNDVLVTTNQISYSNGDSYLYDSANKVIYKNGGILCTNVYNFNLNMSETLYTKKVIVQVTFNKYLNSMERTIISCVEE